MIYNLTAQPSTNNPFVSLLRGFWGLFSVSWKEEVKLNDLRKCVVWGKEAPAGGGGCSQAPGGLEKSVFCSFPSSVLPRRRTFWARWRSISAWLPPSFFLLVFSTCLESETSHPIDIYLVWNASLKTGRGALPCWGATLLQSIECLRDACFSLMVPAGLGKEKRTNGGRESEKR